MIQPRMLWCVCVCVGTRLDSPVKQSVGEERSVEDSGKGNEQETAWQPVASRRKSGFKRNQGEQLKKL
jgi:hypothetical protein